MRKLLLICMLVIMLLVPVSASFTSTGIQISVDRSYAWNWPEWVVDLVQAFCDAHPEICDGACLYC